MEVMKNTRDHRIGLWMHQNSGSFLCLLQETLSCENVWVVGRLARGWV